MATIWSDLGALSVSATLDGNPADATITDLTPRGYILQSGTRIIGEKTPKAVQLAIGDYQIEVDFLGLRQKQKFRIEKNKTTDVIFRFTTPSSGTPTGGGGAPGRGGSGGGPIGPSGSGSGGSGGPSKPTAKNGVYGIVVDAETKKPLRSLVWISTLKRGVSQDNRGGFYQIPNVDTTTLIDVEVRKKGYETFVKQAYSPKNEWVRVDFELVKKKTKRVKVPGLPATVPFSKIAGLLIGIIAGLVVSSILGNIFFFFGFLLFAVHYIMPNVGDIESVKLIMRKARANAYINLKRTIARKDLSDEEKARQVKMWTETLKNSVEVDKIIDQTPSIRSTANLITTIQHLFKVAAMICFVWGIAIAPLPFTKIIALIAGFVGYFYIGGSKIPEKEKV